MAQLNLALDQSDDRFIEAVEEVVRAWGMSEVERSAGIKHTAIYGVFKGKPQFDTVCRVLKGFGAEGHYHPTRTAALAIDASTSVLRGHVQQLVLLRSGCPSIGQNIFQWNCFK